MARKNTLRIALPVETLSRPDGKRALAQAADILRSGGTVAFPTETVYGLGANAFDASAVEEIFIAKQRPHWDPLIVHVADAAMLERVAVHVSARAQQLMNAFWPGPLTLLLPRQDAIPSIVTAGRPLVAVRMPAHPVARALIVAAGVPVAAPSANRFGHTSPTTAQHVLDDLEGRIDLVLDSGAAWCGVESTVVEVRDGSVILYRSGAIASAEIEAIAGPVSIYQSLQACVGKGRVEPESLPSPGVEIRHYAPRAHLIAFDFEDAPEEQQQQYWLQTVAKYHGRARLGVMQPNGWPLAEGFAGIRFDWGTWGDDRQLAQNLFAGLRALDSGGAEVILCPLPTAAGMGAAIRDRLLKAARDS